MLVFYMLSMLRWRSTQTRFSDYKNIRSKAEKNKGTLIRQLRKYWSSKYNMPSNCEYFESRTIADLQEEQLCDLLEKRDEYRSQYEAKKAAKGSNEILVLINDINKALGEELEGVDALAAKWDAEFESGQLPNFDED